MRDGSQSGAADRVEAEIEFRRAVNDVFGPRCKAAWLSGSFVYNGAKPGRSDIDVVVVLDERTAIPADEETLERIESFIQVYLRVHARLGLDPDLEFPAEYVVPAAIDQAIRWRGLALEGRMANEFPPVEHSDYWIGRPDRWFNAWLSETAFSRFLAGDPSYHEASKLGAWKSVLRFILLRSDDRPVGLGELWPRLAQFGVKPSYEPFWPAERAWVQRAIAELEGEGTLERSGDRVLPVRDGLRQWEMQVQAAIAGDRSVGPLLLPPELHRKIGAYASRQWEQLDCGAMLPA
ncbi:MAG TPA: nucleotidyltransferase domain-containing protein [Allosphingosinicella sp.]|nr:nucleotidyltransferase domain-containing protein [Allosphingosinicella sp.]